MLEVSVVSQQSGKGTGDSNPCLGGRKVPRLKKALGLRVLL